MVHDIVKPPRHVFSEGHSDRVQSPSHTPFLPGLDRRYVIQTSDRINQQLGRGGV